MISLTTAKSYLRVDYDTDDALIQSCISGADAYLGSSVDDYGVHYAEDDQFAAQADLAEMAIVQDLYDRRGRMPDAGTFGGTIGSIINRLQNWG